MVEKKQVKSKHQPFQEHGLVDYVDFTYIDQPADERKKLDVGDIFLNQGKALCCGWIIRSKNRHHMAKCKCGKSFIDGGSWYIRTGGEVELHTVNYTERHEPKDKSEDFLIEQFEHVVESAYQDMQGVMTNKKNYRLRHRELANALLRIHRGET